MGKKYIIYWINIAFLVANTAFFVFMLSNDRNNKISDQQAISNDFLRRELNLSESQYTILSDQDSLVQRRYQHVLKLLCRNRYMFLNELAKPHPSPKILNDLSKNVGFLHTALKRQTWQHLLNIKQICTPEQSIKLEQIFKDMLEIDTHCHECKKRCTHSDKCKKANPFCSSREIEDDSLQNPMSLKNDSTDTQ